MSIPPEERRKIYEEEKSRIEGERNRRPEEMTLGGLTRNTAGTAVLPGRMDHRGGVPGA